jgi:hypothetical protein
MENLIAPEPKPTKVKKTNKDYYEAFKLKNQDKISHTVHCDCGGSYSYYSKSTHMKSVKHLKKTLGEQEYLRKQLEKLEQKIKSLV